MCFAAWKPSPFPELLFRKIYKPLNFEAVILVAELGV